MDQGERRRERDREREREKREIERNGDWKRWISNEIPPDKYI